MANENLAHLFKLIQGNPELPIVPMVDGDVVAEPSWGRWLGAWGNAYVDEYLYGKELYHIREDDDLSEAQDTLRDGFVDSTKVDEMSDEELKSAYAKLPWIKAIIVHIDLPEE